MTFSLKIKREKRPNSIWNETISMKMTKSGIMNSAQVAREGGWGRGVVGTSPTNHGYTSHDYNVSMHIIWMKNL